jgi:hypothetical protein
LPKFSTSEAVPRNSPQIHAVAAYGRQGSSARVRLFDWLEHERLSFAQSTYADRASNTTGAVLRAPVASIRAEIRTRRLRPLADRLIMSREATPFSCGRVEEHLLKSAEVGIFDFDDAIFEPGGFSRRVFRSADKADSLVRAADVVIAGNEYLATWAEERNVNVHLVPSCVEVGHYLPKEEWEIDAPPVIGWMGSPSTEPYLLGIADALQRVHDLTGATLRIVSGPDTGRLAPLDHLIDRTSWDPTSFPAELAKFDVAIGPLPDTPFAHGKCAYKLLQYAATGLPMVASPIGANALALARFEGLAATTDADWVTALMDILSSGTAARALQGRTALQAVRSYYSFESNRDAWISAVGLDSQSLKNE